MNNPYKKKKKPKLYGYRKFEKEVPRLDGSKTAGSVINQLLDRMGIAEKVNDSKIVAAWDDVVGAKIARFTTAQSIENGILTVKVKNPIWRNELTYLKEEIKYKLNKTAGKFVVKDIKFL